jgi:hypothetical protein
MDLSFGEVSAVILDELGATESELTQKERENTSAANWHYKRNVLERLRRFFDEKGGDQ